MGLQLKVSSNRLVKPGIKPLNYGLQGKQFIHYTTAAPTTVKSIHLFDLILYLPSTIFQLNRDRSTWAEQVLS